MYQAYKQNTWTVFFCMIKNAENYLLINTGSFVLYWLSIKLKHCLTRKHSRVRWRRPLFTLTWASERVSRLLNTLKSKQLFTTRGHFDSLNSHEFPPEAISNNSARWHLAAVLFGTLAALLNTHVLVQFRLISTWKASSSSRFTELLWQHRRSTGLKISQKTSSHSQSPPRTLRESRCVVVILIFVVALLCNLYLPGSGSSCASFVSSEDARELSLNSVWLSCFSVGFDDFLIF